MIEAIRDLEKAGSWNAMREALGKTLGLDGPVSSSVLNRAREEDKFASHLFISRSSPELLQMFLDDKKNENFRIADETVEKTNMQLVYKAGKAMLDWAAKGFEKVDRATFDKRFSTCEGCDYLAAPPKKMVYKVKLKRESSQKVCTRCGCVAARKAWIPNESCPVEDPSNEGLTLWGEPIQLK